VVAYLNSDDLYQPGALLKVGEFFALHPEAAWISGRCRIVDQSGQEVRKGMTLLKNFWLRLGSFTVLQVLDYISQPATFWRREVLEKVGFFDENLRYAMDYDYSLRLGDHYKLWTMDDYLASFRVHPASKGGSSASDQFDEDLEVAKRHVSSPILISLHSLSNQIVVLLYRILEVIGANKALRGQ
jgi:GT2 family glycosyltransferase